MLRVISGPKSEKVPGSWRKLHNVELHNLYSSLNIRMIKLRMMWHGACMEEKRIHKNLWSEILKGRDHL
jgi:hypothetical protein